MRGVQRGCALARVCGCARHACVRWSASRPGAWVFVCAAAPPVTARVGRVVPGVRGLPAFKTHAPCATGELFVSPGPSSPALPKHPPPPKHASASPQPHPPSPHKPPAHTAASPYSHQRPLSPASVPCASLSPVSSSYPARPRPPSARLSYRKLLLSPAVCLKHYLSVFPDFTAARGSSETPQDEKPLPKTSDNRARL